MTGAGRWAYNQPLCRGSGMISTALRSHFRALTPTQVHYQAAQSSLDQVSWALTLRITALVLGLSFLINKSAMVCVRVGRGDGDRNG